MEFKNLKNLSKDYFSSIREGIPSACTCCGKKHCDQNGKITPCDEFKEVWEKCLSQNVCPCGFSDMFCTFWLRGDGIECSNCR